MSVNITNLTRQNLTNGVAISSGYRSIYYSSHPSNCKLCSLDSVSNFCNEEGILVIKKILKISRKLAFNVQLTDLEYVNILKKHFKVIHIAEIPIGYYGKFQYHCCFLTENTDYSDYKSYLARITEQQEIIKKKTPSKIVEVDSIDSIFASLKNITEQDLKKIKSYKQPKRAKDLLKSILDKE